MPYSVLYRCAKPSCLKATLVRFKGNKTTWLGFGKGCWHLVSHGYKPLSPGLRSCVWGLLKPPTFTPLGTFVLYVGWSGCSDHDADGFTLVKSLVCLIQTLKGKLCVCMRRRGTWRNIGLLLLRPGSCILGGFYDIFLLSASSVTRKQTQTVSPVDLLASYTKFKR